MEGAAIIGLGRMGRRIAARLLGAGLLASVYDIDPAKAEGLDARQASSAKDAVAGAEAAVTMVTDGPAMLAALEGSNGLLAGAERGLLLIDMSTIGVDDSRRVASLCEAAGVRYVRSPVLGTLPSAEAGQLTALTSGPRDAVEAAQPYLRHLCSRQHYLGPAEEGRIAKLAVNGLLACAQASLAEGLVLGEKAGLDADQLLDVFAGSSMVSPALKGAVQAMRERTFEPRLTARLLAKDLRLLAEAAEANSMRAPMAGTALPLFDGAAEMGWGDLDTSAVLLVLEALAGIRP
jgi:3-hydroxyisobutyrate dehydrogenase-like beta-hydroxyacid dehydrogenase